ncbi:MAG TPA: FeS-binding protein, partial [Saprospiraceae bacterium]|nr:FeS-binding protein [Saprospiraceae bacterium]
MSIRQKIALSLASSGAGMLLLVWATQRAFAPALLLPLTLALMAGATALLVWDKYATRPAGIKNDGVWFNGLTARGAWAWLAAAVLTGFYTVLYFCPPAWLQGLTDLFKPLSLALRDCPADKWFVYGSLYTFAV